MSTILWLVTIDQRYEIQAVGSTREEALKLAEQRWDLFWDAQTDWGFRPFYSTFQEMLEDGAVRVYELKPGRSYVEWDAEMGIR